MQHKIARQRHDKAISAAASASTAGRSAQLITAASSERDRDGKARSAVRNCTTPMPMMMPAKPIIEPSDRSNSPPIINSENRRGQNAQLRRNLEEIRDAEDAEEPAAPAVTAKQKDEYRGLKCYRVPLAATCGRLCCCRTRGLCPRSWRLNLALPIPAQIIRHDGSSDVSPSPRPSEPGAGTTQGLWLHPDGAAAQVLTGNPLAPLSFLTDAAVSFLTNIGLVMMFLRFRLCHTSPSRSGLRDRADSP